MPYDRDQVIAAVTDYYEFLTRLHMEPKDIRRPPPEGWSTITPERMAPIKKNSTVVELMKHLPYVQNDDNFTPIVVWILSGCNDYTGWDFQSKVEDGHRSAMMMDEDLKEEDCTWEKFKGPQAHILPLASPAVGLTGMTLG